MGENRSLHDNFRDSLRSATMAERYCGRPRCSAGNSHNPRTFIGIICEVCYELARCMALMKNLHTVQILCYRNLIRLPGRRGMVAISNLCNDAFAGYRFPSVRRIVFSLHEVALFPCFPEARRVYMTLPYSRFTWDWALGRTRELASHCHKVHVFEWNVDRDIPWTVRKGKCHI